MDKECLKCGETKALKMFRPADGNRDGKNHYCIECHSIYPPSELIFLGDKQCRKCNAMKPRSEFGVTTRQWGTFLQTYCKQCSRMSYSNSRIAYKASIVSMSPLKICLNCKIEKPILTFPASIGNPDRKSHFCWDCKKSHPWEKLIVLGTKICTYCKEEKPRTCFEIRTKAQELNSMCSVCFPMYRKARYDRNPDKFREQSRTLQRKYWQLYPERLRAIARERQKTPRQRQLRLLSQRMMVDSMSDTYILYLLKSQTGIEKKTLRSMEGIADIINAHKSILKLKRVVKSVRNE